jgi:hypothetical protein
MPRHVTGLAVLAMLALSCGAARAADGPRADDPDPGFLEFLGSVDRLAEVNPDYMSQAEAAKVATPGAQRPPAPANPPSTPPPPPPRQPPPSAANAAGGQNNE